LTRKWPKSLRESKKTLKKSSKKPERVEKIFIQLKTVGKKLQMDGSRSLNLLMREKTSNALLDIDPIQRETKNPQRMTSKKN